MQPNARVSRTFDYAPEVQINYEVHGSGARTAVLLHGFGASLESWRELLPHLERDLHLHLIDLKGFGLSSKNVDRSYSLEDQADIVIAFLEHQQLTQVCLVGHSYGGAVAEIVLLKLLEQGGSNPIERLILIGAPAATQRLPFFISPLRNPMFRPFLEMAPARARVRFILKRIVFDPRSVTEKQVERYARFVSLPGSVAAMAAAARQLLPKDPQAIAGRLDRIRVPLLLIWGDHDRVVPRWQADLLAQRIPGSKLVILPQCGHLPPEEQPEETARAILSFLAG